MSRAAFSKLKPLFDRVMVEKFAVETQTKSGIMIPEKAAGKVLEATVIATGPGQTSKEGKTIACSVQPGDRVLLPEYGGTKISLNDKEYFIYRDTDILGKLE